MYHEQPSKLGVATKGVLMVFLGTPIVLAVSALLYLFLSFIVQWAWNSWVVPYSTQIVVLPEIRWQLVFGLAMVVATLRHILGSKFSFSL